MKRYLISSTNLATILRACFKSSTLYSGLYVLLVAAITFVGCAEKYDDSAIVERLNKLEGTTIKDINGQISAINKTIDDLKAFDSYFESYTNNTIDSIQNVLRDYVDNNLSTTTDWCSATFATLEKYNITVTDLVLLEQRVSIMDSTYNDTIAAINQKIEQAIFDMRDWVNTCFTNYYDIAQIDAKLAMLESKVKDADSISKARIAQLYTNLDSTQAALTRGYKEAISSAIETNNGVINSRIADEIDAVNTHINNEIGTINLRIASLEGRVSTLEERVNELSKQLGIRFSDNNVSCSPGDIVNIDYTLINATDTTEVYALPSNGYKAKVTKSSKSAGTISVTIPNPIENGTVLIFVNNGDRTVTKSLNFISGTMSISAVAVMADADGGDISVNLSTDLQYTVKIPAEATWVHYKDITTKSAMRNETINFSVDENVLSVPRSTVVELVNASGLTIGSVTIRQGCNVLQPNEIWYTSTDMSVISPVSENVFGSNIISNVYGKSKGIITFEGDVKRIGYRAFFENAKLLSISIPDKVALIDESALNGCTSLVSVIIPGSVKEIGASAFAGCSSLSAISIPNSVITIGLHAFEYSGLKTIEIPSSITVIKDWTFCNCHSLETVTIPNSITTIGAYAFQYCSNLTGVILPETLRVLDAWAFTGCSNLKKVVIPNMVTSGMRETFYNCSNLEVVSLSSYGIYDNTFAACTKIKEVYVRYAPPSINKDVFKNCSLDELTLYVPKGQKTFYQNLDVFKDFGSIVEMDTVVLSKPEAVDLGLSVKWASFNVGAQFPEEFGMYFAWGDLYPKRSGEWSSYKWCKGVDYSLTKYNNDSKLGDVDNKTQLEITDDAANFYLGGDWRMPTQEDFNELLNNCDCEWTTQNGVNGLKVTSRKDSSRSIFLPAAGTHYDSISEVGGGGNYWASTLYTPAPRNARSLNFDPGIHYVNGRRRDYGLSIRAVCP